MRLIKHLTLDTGPNPDASVIWLHGLGADGIDFEPVVPHLKMAGATRFIFPHAPSQPVTINGGYVMPAWYDILEMSFGRKVDSVGIGRSRDAIRELIAVERARGIPASRIVLAGFSQGGAMSLDVGLRHEEQLAGLLILSAYLPLPDALEQQTPNWNAPILQCHGTHDMVVPTSLGAEARDALKSQGLAVDWRTYPCPHSLHPTEIDEIGTWLNGLLF